MKFDLFIWLVSGLFEGVSIWNFLYSVAAAIGPDLSLVSVHPFPIDSGDDNI